MNFREATDMLFGQIDHDKLAEELRVSVASIRQARLKPEAQAHRTPPKQWERAVLALAEQQIAHYQKLASQLRQESELQHRILGLPKRGRAITN